MKTGALTLVLAWISIGCTCCHPSAATDPAAKAHNHLLVQFSREAGLQGWQVEDDVVMGGRSQGHLAINEAGNAVFSGEVSLENNGGFSSVQCDVAPVDASSYRTIALGLKGDGKRYQLRVDSTKDARHSYAYDFQTSGDWEVVEIPIAEMYAIHHGDRLDLPNYPGKRLARMQILIGNGVAESFQLEIDRIWLK
jgi:hypothetical protein